ncbi:MAG: hypothetical protein ABIK28_08300 [Planctomycetota bacterium]
MRSIIAVAGITFLDTLRLPAFRIGSLAFLAISMLGAVPFSPGIAADPGHYADAGVSTLYLGGVFLSFMAVPLLLMSGERGCGISRMLICLPVTKMALILGMFSGFALPLLLYFVVGGVLQMSLGTLNPPGLASSTVITCVFRSYMLSLVISSIVLFFSQAFSFVAAVAGSLLVVIFGYAAPYLGLPLGLCFPAFYCLDPFSNQDNSITCLSLKIIHGIILIFLYIWLASRCVGKTEKRGALML